MRARLNSYLAYSAGCAAVWAVLVFVSQLGLALGLAGALLIVDGLGWRAVAGMFDRERLVTGSRRYGRRHAPSVAE